MFTLSETCDTCGGTGSVERTRDRRLEELTSQQMQFLYQAQLERKKAENGVDDDGEPMEDPNTGGSSMPNTPSGVSTPNGGPPMSGPAKRF